MPLKIFVLKEEKKIWWTQDACFKILLGAPSPLFLFVLLFYPQAHSFSYFYQLWDANSGLRGVPEGSKAGKTDSLSLYFPSHASGRLSQKVGTQYSPTEANNH